MQHMCVILAVGWFGGFLHRTEIKRRFLSVQVSSMGLSSLGRLVTLYLEENHIEELEDYSLRNLSSLEELYINHNRISSIGPKAFAGLTNLLR